MLFSDDQFFGRQRISLDMVGRTARFPVIGLGGVLKGQ
jgi:hypothetical protein